MPIKSERSLIYDVEGHASSWKNPPVMVIQVWEVILMLQRMVRPTREFTAGSVPSGLKGPDSTRKILAASIWNASMSSSCTRWGSFQGKFLHVIIAHRDMLEDQFFHVLIREGLSHAEEVRGFIERFRCKGSFQV